MSNNMLKRIYDAQQTSLEKPNETEKTQQTSLEATKIKPKSYRWSKSSSNSTKMEPLNERNPSDPNFIGGAAPWLETMFPTLPFSNTEEKNYEKKWI